MTTKSELVPLALENACFRLWNKMSLGVFVNQYKHPLEQNLMKRDFQFTKSVIGENWEKPRTAHWNYESAVEFETAKDFGMRIGFRKWKKFVEPDGD